MTGQQRALIVDDEPDIRELVSLALSRMGLEVDEAADVESGKHALAKHGYAVCLTDLNLPDGSGMDLVEHIHDQQLDTAVAVITAYGDLDTAVTALKLGAFDFVSKPLDLGKLRQLVTQALQLPEQHSGDNTAEEELLIGDSPPMLALKEMIRRVARSQAPTHITGESGTGKELVARLIHLHSNRRTGPFVPVNCGAIPGELMESEFFGHKKGSFTGAIADKPGLFQTAEGGTLFLDEVADLPLHMQVKLLRVLQEKTVRPVGAANELPIDVRIVSATHKDLRTAITDQLFREDLYYRINVIEIAVPSLRERTADIPALAAAILARLATANGTPSPKLTEEALLTLCTRPFPGNVRELENVLERAMAMSDGREISAADLSSPSNKTDKSEIANTNELPDGVSMEEHLESIESSLITNALQATQNNKTDAASKLGMTFRQLRYRIKKLNLNL